MKKFLLSLLSVIMLTACGNKNENSVNPLGSVEIGNILPTTETTVSISETATQTTTRPAEKKKINTKSEMLIDVPYYSQHDYPTGCELVSTSMLLANFGFDIKAGELIEKGYLNAVDVTEKDGKKYGGDPDKVFVGNPAKNTGYGCHSGAIIYALNKYLKPQEYKLDKKYEITDLKGMELDEICDEYISRGIPVIMWASINMKPTFQKLINSWIVEKTGKRYFWKSNEHCLVLVGYDEENYYFNDPLVKKNTPYMKRLAERRYGEMGMQAIAVEEITQ
ncbi:MAG: C39 family peptidase [Ruminococcus sp.]|nr:C39 family peptidase [Ruminococcus sp.]MDE6538995.1 C39 family peptidase [Ruminococcus sp.]